MRGLRLPLLAAPMLLLCGCPESVVEDGGSTEDVGLDRSRDRTVDFATDTATDSVAEPRPDVAPDSRPDTVLADTVSDTRRDTTVDQGGSDTRRDTTLDPGTDPGTGEFDACMPGILAGGVTAAYGESAEGDSFLLYIWDDSDTEPTMELAIEIYTSYAGPTGPGTYPIDATEADYATCGLCILAYTETEVYMPVANSGSVTISQMTVGESMVGSTFAGSFDVTMQAVEIDSGSYATTPVAGGCRGTLQHTFSETVQLYEY